MRISYDCIPCLLRQMNHAMRAVNMDDAGAEAAIRQLLRYFLDADLGQSPPDLSRGAWAVIAQQAGTDDPYRQIKARFNREMLAYYDDLEGMIQRAPDPDLAAVKLAITGNIIDLGAVQGIDRQGVLAALRQASHKPLVVDDTAALYGALARATTLLYLGDNCGEIVFDKAFIAHLSRRFPALQVHYGVRGSPILNDVTRADAQMVGMDQVATVVDNGDAAPGTVLDAVSPEFRALFYDADVVIGKGQGNFESLGGVDRPHVYLLFMAKCQVVAGLLGVEPMSLVCMEANARPIAWDGLGYHAQT